MSRSHIFQITVAVATVIATALIGLTLIVGYARADEFLLYRLALNLNVGHGLTYNPEEATLVTLSPGLPVLLALIPQQAQLLATLIWTFTTGLIAVLIVRLLQRHHWSNIATLITVTVWLFSYPLWVSYRSPAMVGFFLILLALDNADEGRLRSAGVLAGVAGLFHLSSLIGAVLVGVYLLHSERARRYWHTVWVPVALWALLAIFGYDDYMVRPVDPDGSWQDILTILILMVAVGILYRFQRRTSWIWIFPIWGALEVTASLSVTGELTQVSSLPLAFSVALAIASLFSYVRLLALTLAICNSIMIILAPPQIPTQVAADLSLAADLDIEPGSSLVHDRSDALIYGLTDFEGSAYRLDGVHSPTIASPGMRASLASLLVQLAPDYILLTDDDWHNKIAFDDPGLEALKYQQSPNNTDLWRRRTVVATLPDWQSSSSLYGEDMQLRQITVDRHRPLPGEPIRVGLSWLLQNLPSQDDVTLNISLIDPFGTPVATIFPTLPLAVWQYPQVATYHALQVPGDTSPGLYAINVAVDYRAALLGRHDVGQIVVPFDRESVDITESVGSLGPLQLHEVQLTEVGERELNIQTNWSVSEGLGGEYMMFMHLSTLDDLVPVRQADGPPVNGGRISH